MSRRIDPDTAVTVTVGIRLPTALLDLLDAEVDLVSAPGAQPTRASVARALLASVLVDRAAARAKPVQTKAPTPAPRAETKSRKPTIRDTVIAAMHTAERPDTDTMSIPTVVRACIALHPVDAIHAVLEKLVREGVIEMRPDSGYGSDLTAADRELCPRSIQRGEVLSTVRWQQRT